MNTREQTPLLEQQPDFGMDILNGNNDFDINAAFQEAIAGVANDSELALEEKVRRMEVIIGEGTSEVYRDFVDFRQMAAQMEMACNHDHSLNQSMQGSDMVSGFMNSHKADDGHNHNNAQTSYSKNSGDDSEIDEKTGKKSKKKRRSWFSLLIG